MLLALLLTFARRPYVDPISGLSRILEPSRGKFMWILFLTRGKWRQLFRQRTSQQAVGNHNNNNHFYFYGVRLFNRIHHSSRRWSLTPWWTSFSCVVVLSIPLSQLPALRRRENTPGGYRQRSNYSISFLHLSTTCYPLIVLSPFPFFFPPPSLQQPYPCKNTTCKDRTWWYEVALQI